MYYNHYNTRSLLRRAEYDALSQVTLHGTILDVGGSKKSGYHELIKGDHTFTVGNKDDTYGIDEVFNAEEAWPAGNASYDSVLFINLLEHLYNYQNAIRESYRVLRDGGHVVGVVPFMFNVHGSPSDYYRYTRSTLERLFKDAGFKNVQVKELGTGAFSVIYHCLIGFVRWNWLANVLITLFVSLDTCLAKIKPGNKMGAAYMPLGYFFMCKK